MGVIWFSNRCVMTSILAPVLLELPIWGTRHKTTGAPSEVISQIAQNRDAVLEETRRRVEEARSVPSPDYAIQQEEVLNAPVL